jgi:hypothetical protein
MTMPEYAAAFDASAARAAADPRLLIGDASEQTLTYYYAQNMRGHRRWSAVVPACFDGCARNHTDQAAPAFVECAEECWRRGERAHAEVCFAP